MASASPSGPSSATWPRWRSAKRGGAVARLGEQLLDARGALRTRPAARGPRRRLRGRGRRSCSQRARLEQRWRFHDPLDEAPRRARRRPPAAAQARGRHELGAFKWRGALPSLERYRERRSGRGGHRLHRQPRRRDRVGGAAHGLRAVVYVPEQASRAKLELLERLGAELRHAGADVDEAKDAARAHAEREGLPFFEDGAEPAQFEGYAAIGARDRGAAGRAARAHGRAGRQRRAADRRGARPRRRRRAGRGVEGARP